MSIIEKHKHKKCLKALEVVEKKLKDSTSHNAIVYLGKIDGYDELFQMVQNKGWSYELLGNKKEGFHISVTSQ